MTPSVNHHGASRLLQPSGALEPRCEQVVFKEKNWRKITLVGVSYSGSGIFREWVVSVPKVQAILNEFVIIRATLLHYEFVITFRRLGTNRVGFLILLICCVPLMIRYYSKTMCTLLHCTLINLIFLWKNMGLSIHNPKSYVISTTMSTGRSGSSEVPRNPLTRWDVSSIPANGIFPTKKLKNKIKMPNGWRTINSLVHKIRLHGRRGKVMAESFSREKLKHAPQKEGGWEILRDLPAVWPRLVRPTNLISRMNGKKTHNKTHNQYRIHPALKNLTRRRVKHVLNNIVWSALWACCKMVPVLFCHFYDTMLDGVLHCLCFVFTRGCSEGLGAFWFFFKYDVVALSAYYVIFFQDHVYIYYTSCKSPSLTPIRS